MSTANTLLDVLRDWGVRQVFSCPGSTEAAVLDALVGRDRPELVLTTHESVAVSMADGLARATGEPSVAYLHTNVGLANGVAHLYAAHLARSPVTVLTGLKPTAIQGREGFTTAPYVRDLVRQHVKWAWQSVSPEAVPEDVNRALRTSLGEPCGPTWVGLSQDLLGGEHPVPGPDVTRFRPRARTRPDPAGVVAAAAALCGARRPVLVAGAEVARHRASAALGALAERIGAPVLHEDRRTFQRSAFPTDHPHYAGMYSPTHRAVREADVLFFAGARVFTEFEAPDGKDLPPGALVLHSHVDGHEVGRLHGVDVGLVGDTALVLADLLAELPAPTEPSEPGDGWVGALRAAWLDRAPLPSGAGFPGHLDLDAVVAELAGALEPGTPVVVDATTAGAALLRDLPQVPDQLFATASGSLGWGAGAALGVALGRPGQRVVAVLGDGVFQFGVPALWTAVRHRIPVTFLVLNNQTYSAVASALHRYGGAARRSGVWPGTDIAGPRIATIAEGFGVPALRVEGAAGLRKGWADLAGTPGPVLLEVMTGPSV